MLPHPKHLALLYIAPLYNNKVEDPALKELGRQHRKHKATCLKNRLNRKKKRRK